MNTRNKKLLFTMITSTMLSCPVWAADTTGYDAATGQQVENTVSSTKMSAQEEAKPAAVNAVITSPNSQETAEAIKQMNNWQRSQVVRLQNQFVPQQNKNRSKRLRKPKKNEKIR